ncbi:MAG: VWA containing CoxE family protein, partial [Cyclobacteriaceae bacterium]
MHDFDYLFKAYWEELEKAIDSKINTEINPIKIPGSEEAAFKSLKSWLNGNRNNEKEETASYSVGENLSQKDFSAV